MNEQPTQIATFPPPPSVIKTLGNGFNTVANHIYLILLPVLLDLFIWLYPGISISKYTQPALQYIADLSPDLPAEAIQILSDLFQNFNLFTLLRTMPIGVASLFSASLEQINPLAATSAFEVSGLSQLLGFILLINIAGILLGWVYFRQIADVSAKPIRPRAFRQALNVLLITLAWLVFFLLINIPVSLLILLVGALSGILRTIVVILLMIPASWLLLYVYYSYYPLFLNDLGIISALKKTFTVVRFSAPTLGWFSIISLMLSEGLNLLWSSAPANSWVSIVGILGHGFISAGLLAASFIYYNKISIWVDDSLRWFAVNRPTGSDHSG